MKILKIFVLFLLLLNISNACTAQKQQAPKFIFSHTKAQICDQNWLLMENLIIEDQARCKDIFTIEGFPYLRGTRNLLDMASNINGKYSEHEWIELLRRVDLQTRYLELDLLPEKTLKKFCDAARIECFSGRIRAYVARCSAIIMGDEKRNPDFMKALKKQAEAALRFDDSGIRACFEDSLTMDGLITDDVLNSIISPQKTKGLSKSYLQQRIQRLKQMNTPYK